MTTLIAVLRLLPVVLAAVRAVEEAVPMPGQGKKKLDLILDILKTAHDGGSDLAKDFSWDKLVGLVVPMIGKIVELHNELGLFSKEAPQASQG
jgi:hypothetical protein